MLKMLTPTTLPAVFESREYAEAAVKELTELGLGEDEIGIVIPNLESGWYRLLDEEERNEFQGLVHGVEFGAPAGAIAGIALMAFAIPGAGTLAAGGLLAGAGVGAYWGVLIGAWAGLTKKVHWNQAEDRWIDVPINTKDVVVVVHPGHHYDEVHRIMAKYGARYFLDPDQPEHPIGFQPTS